MSLNLASRPFVNSRPVRRLVLVLWCLSAVLVAANLFFYARHLTGQEARRGRLDELAEIERRQSDRVARLERQLAAADLDWQNRQVRFLNLRIAERTFPWSRLFDRLAEVLPHQVRLTSLRPSIGRGRRGEEVAPERVGLEIRGQARNDQAMLTLITRLFEHPAFRDPNLSSESRDDNAGVIDFVLSATYLPSVAAAAPAAVAAAEEEGP